VAHYFRFWLLAPLLLGTIGMLVPAISFGVIGFAEEALYVAGVPYAIFVVGALVWSRRRSEAQYKVAFMMSPLLFGVCCFGGWLVALPILGQEVESWPMIVATGTMFALWCSLVSAAYCWPPLALWYVLAFLLRD